MPQAIHRPRDLRQPAHSHSLTNIRSIERFHRILAAEWAYAKPYANEAERTAAHETWLHHYNHHRPHTGIGGQTPAERVHNVPGNYT